MIIGIGTDAVEIDRMIKSIENTGFLTRFFTDNENQYFMKKKNSPQTIAGTFAAKEAVSKALGTGFRQMSLKDIEILHDNLGKPYAVLHNKVKEFTEDATLHISISHTENIAVAFAVLEKNLERN